MVVASENSVHKLLELLPGKVLNGEKVDVRPATRQNLSQFEAQARKRECVRVPRGGTWRPSVWRGEGCGCVFCGVGSAYNVEELGEGGGGCGWWCDQYVLGMKYIHILAWLCQEVCDLGQVTLLLRAYFPIWTRYVMFKVPVNSKLCVSVFKNQCIVNGLNRKTCLYKLPRSSHPKLYRDGCNVINKHR